MDSDRVLHGDWKGGNRAHQYMGFQRDAATRWNPVGIRRKHPVYNLHGKGWIASRTGRGYRYLPSGSVY